LRGVPRRAAGAAGALEAIATVITLEQQQVPPTANLRRLDLDLDVVSGAPRPARISAAVSNSFGFGGQNAALILRAS
jgi:3-oxoacyl-[acyl-carrier-protein] synthase II